MEIEPEHTLTNEAEFRCPCTLCVEARKRRPTAMPLDALRQTPETPALRLVPRLRNAFSAGA